MADKQLILMQDYVYVWTSTHLRQLSQLCQSLLQDFRIVRRRWCLFQDLPVVLQESDQLLLISIEGKRRNKSRGETSLIKDIIVKQDRQFLCSKGQLSGKKKKKTATVSKWHARWRHWILRRESSRGQYSPESLYSLFWKEILEDDVSICFVMISLSNWKNCNWSRKWLNRVSILFGPIHLRVHLYIPREKKQHQTSDKLFYVFLVCFLVCLGQLFEQNDMSWKEDMISQHKVIQRRRSPNKISQEFQGNAKKTSHLTKKTEEDI